MALSGIRLGLPMWSLPAWRGTVYPRGVASAAWLHHYARHFNTVEGNTTFYAVPAADTVRRWADAVGADFRFSFKLPRTITHDQALRPAVGEVGRFLERMAPIGERLGPFMVQLPPGFGPDHLDRLDAFLGGWPRERPVAVEVRHPRFVADRDARRRLAGLLALYGASRVLMDTRPLDAGEQSSAAVREARERKPALPVDPDDCVGDPMVRFVAHPDAAASAPFAAQWQERCAQWLAGGRRPWLFVHCADNAHAPRIARDWHRELAARVPGLGTLELEPGATGPAAPAADQLSLF